ncbi:MAG TPA: DnaJ domain-containing protein [Candidatus Limnocylindria bacterium]|nr:DnaJ domain-containing protein [Candidatus Limnocylindria bacterium]
MDLRLLPYQPDRDVYRLLGVAPSAGRAEIVSACRRLARAFHPDRNESERATEEMQVVNAVRSVLIDPRSRAEYDHARLTFIRQHEIASPIQGSAPRPARPTAAEHGGKELRRTARAAMVALLAGVRALPPARCDDCSTWVQPDFRFCPACGARLRGAMPLIATERS